MGATAEVTPILTGGHSGLCGREATVAYNQLRANNSPIITDTGWAKGNKKSEELNFAIKSKKEFSMKFLAVICFGMI